MASCALVGWTMGGKLWLAAIWTGLAGWMLMTPVQGSDAYDALARGWALVLSASFGIVSAVGTRRPFFSRALSATAITFAVGFAVMIFARLEPDAVGGHITEELQRRLSATTAQWDVASGTPEWREFVEKYPGAAGVMEQGQRQLRALPALTVTLFPALLALESMAMLALAWSLYHRASRTRIGPPLRPLSAFRFNDQLVWGLVLGVTVLVLPTLQEARGIGLNLVVVFGLLYALRGLGVLDWFLNPRGATRLLFFIAIFLAWPVVGVFSLGLGLGDTWIDWRARARPTT
jgi:hypothetical protein